ncbi:ribokinase [Listeria fleischmannii]|uniref:Ribokinase n=1 Tax=Listeria fleischmannii FSL S10-1203 TaxID=1265822 RepID=W7DMG7_9LIST|nr:ribokinase [Listeria fleischmannii]EUJ57915.1 ribokinase [Listeria fleischmannii FSL S10-1203]
MTRICIVGSLNTDTTMSLPELPKIGETLEGQKLSFSAGGKGFNQAITARRLGSDVAFIGAVGKDDGGAHLNQVLQDEKIDARHVQILDAPTGMAWILIDAAGKNMILTYGGANLELTAAHIKAAGHTIQESDVVVSQFEVQEEAILEAFRIARRHGKITILNPAPAKTCSDELLSLTDYFIPNETEFEVMTGEIFRSAEQNAMRELFQKGCQNVIVTCGAEGSVIVTKEHAWKVPAVKTTAVDSTAAGDSFIGTLAHFIAQKRSVEEAAQIASKVAARVVEKYGAYTSIPSSKEMERYD